MFNLEARPRLPSPGFFTELLRDFLKKGCDPYVLFSTDLEASGSDLFCIFLSLHGADLSLVYQLAFVAHKVSQHANLILFLDILQILHPFLRFNKAFFVGNVINHKGGLRAFEIELGQRIILFLTCCIPKV